ncbi:MAG: lipoyl(octanoyl) transferase LipB [Actinomycetes bacterium]
MALKSLGLVPYEDALAGQRKIHAEVADGTRTNTLILLEHPPVYTAGRRTTIEERPLDGTPVIDVDRGGKITYHGPGQIVGYPIIKLKNRNDVVGYVREIESALIEVCKEFGINAEAYCERSGVWLRDERGDRKIAAIGIRVAKGVTMHGFALNVSPDLLAFERIIPCGFTDSGVTSMAAELGRPITIEEVTPVLEKHLFEALNRVSA